MKSAGSVEVICGSMFCGKTEELIRRVRRAMIAQKTVQVFKHRVDERYKGADFISSHNGSNIEAQPILDAAEIPHHIHEDTSVVAIDEAQFFADNLPSIVLQLAHAGLRVIVAGLDTDFRGEPFGSMPALLSLAEDVTKLRAICVICGDPASHTQRLVNGEPAYYDDPLILIGATESYEARCRFHHTVPQRE
ncbi:MAG: thymidine kinase [Chloroflexi bacterium]|nr:thymidine kinase [Chloroflexota bacterium]